MALRVVEGDLLEQDVEVIVNAWNRNLFPWWLLLPQGVSGAIRRRAGTQPFRELRRFGLIPLGGAVRTGAGTGGRKREAAQRWLCDELAATPFDGEVRVVVWPAGGA